MGPMKQKFSFFLFSFFFIFLILFTFIRCGSNPVLDTPSSGSSSSDDTESTSDTTAVMSIQEFGSSSNDPANSVLTSLSVIFDCNSKDASDPDTDYVSVTCTVGSSSVVYDYYCVDGITERENQGDTSDTAELFEDVSVTCSNSSGTPILTEEELIVS